MKKVTFLCLASAVLLGATTVLLGADVDRLVVLGGKTYLNGTLGDGEASAQVTWSKQSGPGTVHFEDAHARVTTATFSSVGDYVLKLSASGEASTSSSTVNVTVISPPPTDHLERVYTKPFAIDNPLWSSRAKALIVNWIPHCIDQINDETLRTGGIDNFIEAAKALRGEPHERHKGYVFSNAWVYQTIESMCIALMIDPRGDQEIIAAQAKMKETLEDWIPKILAAQEPDGYLQTAFTLSDRQRWSPQHRRDHEGYVAGYFLEAAILHHKLTNGADLRLYDAARKLADCWVANIGPDKRQWYDGHQGMKQALVRFGRFVNDVEDGDPGDGYIELAKFLLDCRGGGRQYDQSHVPVQQQYEAVGHAVRAVYSYTAMADIATETHEHDYWSAVMSLWDNIVNKKYYVTGGIGSGETSEGFGPNYSLRHNSYCESCSSCGLIFFQHKLNLAHHDAKYVDLYEETLYNALLGAMDLEAKTFAYTNPLVDGTRTEWHGCPCCVGNIPRTLLMLPTWMYAKSDEGICVNLFIGSTVNVGNVAGTNVQMVQKTDYPWSGDVSITVNPEQAARFSVSVRVPDRNTSVLYTHMPEVGGLKSLLVNGVPVAPKIENGYAAITRDWSRGDRIDLVLPLTVQRIKSDEKVAANRGRVALRYGPLIYNVERADGQEIDRVLAPDTPLTAEWRPDFLQGVTVIKGTWADGSPLTAIPNYARNNRAAPARDAVGGPGTTDESAGGGGGARGRGRAANSTVWVRDQ